jgi:hypothetical protein
VLATIKRRFFFFAAKTQIGAGFGQMDLADEFSARRVTAHAILFGIGPTNAIPASAFS